MISLQDTIPIGTVTRTYGNKGEVQALMLNDRWENSDAEFVVLMPDSLPVPFRVLDWRTKGEESIIFTLYGITDEKQARRLVGTEIRMFTRDAQESEADGPAETSLIGFATFTADGNDIGHIIRIDDSTANILAETDKGHLFPLHDDLIQEWDPSGTKLVLTLTEVL